MVGFPVVDVVAPSSATGRVERGLTFSASSRALTSWSMETLRPFRGMKPWLASELSMGHGLRSRLGLVVSRILFT